MTFAGHGHHRATRGGGNHERKNAEIFLNTFNGKLGEFAVYEYFTQQGLNISKVDLTPAGVGVWDNGDLECAGLNISVKTIKSYSNLLLLETSDWDENGQYIPGFSKINRTKNVNVHILVRLRGNKDLERILKAKRKFYSELTYNEVNELIDNFNVDIDIVGIATPKLIAKAVNNNQIIYQNEILGENTPMQADNYYLQTGELIEIERLIQYLLQQK